tara:strand:+ start:1301 stop:1519 length:219 start_codon:yes stop_codon:yes gene_type:complete
MEENNSPDKIPQEILGRPVIGECPECKGEGLLWVFEGDAHWADSCKNCNCIGFILDLPDNWKRQSNDCDIPF